MERNYVTVTPCILNCAGLTAVQLNVAVHSRSEVAPLLVYHGARMDARDRHGRTLLAAAIHNVRLDCESLAVLMVQAGYDLRHDLWLDPHFQPRPDPDPPDPCLLYTSPSPRDRTRSRMPSSA